MITEEKIKAAVAIYRGLPDQERAERIFELRHVVHYGKDFGGVHCTPEVKRFAAILLNLYEQYEADVQRKQEQMYARVRLDILNSLPASVRNGQTVQNTDNPRHVRALVLGGCFAIVLVGFGYWLVQTGYIAYLGGALLLGLIVSALSKPGNSDSDDEKKTGATATAQNIHINIAGHGGQIHVTQGQ